MLKSLLIFALAGLSTALLQRNSAATRHFIWFVALRANWLWPIPPIFWRANATRTARRWATSMGMAHRNGDGRMDPAEPADTQSGFDGWGKPGRMVNISYEYRVSLTETNSLHLKEVKTYQKLNEVGHRALVVDIISYGAGRFAHSFKHNFVRGDGSVALFTDKESPPLWEQYGWQPVENNDVIFTALDHPLNYKDYLR